LAILVALALTDADDLALAVWAYPVSVDGVGLGNWFDACAIQFGSMTFFYFSSRQRRRSGIIESCIL
jgi:hypothetical protein